LSYAFRSRGGAPREELIMNQTDWLPGPGDNGNEQQDRDGGMGTVR
jgi:hypothetical protein